MLLDNQNIEKQFHQPKDLYLLQPVLSLGHLCTVLYRGVHALMRYFLLRVNNYAFCIVSNSLTSKVFWILSIHKLDQQIYRYFFLQHLKHDINMLSLSLGKSEDDTCLLMHLILKQLSSVTGKK